MLASDLNNPEFVGAINPDDALYVKFEMYTPEDANKSIAAGRKVMATRFEKQMKEGKEVWVDTGDLLRVPYVTIMKPGDSTSIMHLEVREDHKRRWPRHWLAFQIEEGLVEDGSQLPGWKIEEWDQFKDDKESIRNLKHMRFYTVEQIASASDAQVQRMGLGGMGLREAAKNAIRSKMGLDVRKEIASKDAQMAAMQKQIEELSALVKRPAQSPSAGAPDAGPKTSDPAAPRETIVTPKRRGRPRKVRDGEQHPT